MTIFAPHDAQMSFTSGKLTFDERVALHRVDSGQIMVQGVLHLPLGAYGPTTLIGKQSGKFLVKLFNSPFEVVNLREKKAIFFVS